MAQAREHVQRPAAPPLGVAGGRQWPKAPQWWRRNTLVRSLTLLIGGAIVLALIGELLSEYRDLQLADGAYYFAALAGLTVLIGLSGQISLGHGALMMVGAYTVALLVADEHWPIAAALIVAVLVSALVGIAVGAAASRLRGPYLAGATLAFAVGLPGSRLPVLLALRRCERPHDRTACAPVGARLGLPAGALGGVDRRRRRAFGRVRALQLHPQRRGALAARGARRRDRGDSSAGCAWDASRRSRSS